MFLVKGNSMLFRHSLKHLSRLATHIKIIVVISVRHAALVSNTLFFMQKDDENESWLVIIDLLDKI